MGYYLLQMDVILCVYLSKSNIHTLLIQKSIASSDYEIHCQRSIPLSSLCISENGRKEYIFGLDASGFSELLPNSVVLKDPADFMRIPMFSGKI